MILTEIVIPAIVSAVVVTAASSPDPLWSGDVGNVNKSQTTSDPGYTLSRNLINVKQFVKH